MYLFKSADEILNEKSDRIDNIHYDILKLIIDVQVLTLFNLSIELEVKNYNHFLLFVHQLIIC